MNLLLNADAHHIPLADGSVNCCVTSPPYYGLRSYLDADSELKDVEIGLEPTPDEYVAGMVQVFREVWRVLRDDGTVWLNLGDGYASNNATIGRNDEDRNTRNKWVQPDEAKRANYNANGASNQGTLDRLGNLKPKDLIGIPWRVAFALQADGWYLRQDIIWHKPNPMPESVKDRCTKAHEYIFLLTKNSRYWYDNEAVKEESIEPIREREKYNGESAVDTKIRGSDGNCGNNGKRNRRSVWTVTTKPYSGAHYAVFPPDLIEPCVLAGCPPKVCAECGAPWERVVESDRGFDENGNCKACGHTRSKHIQGEKSALRKQSWGKSADSTTMMDDGAVPCGHYNTLGWQPTCECDADTRPGIVLDPFIGSGTTAMVARKHGRNAVGLDLNFEYLTTNARERLQYGSYVPVADGITQLTIGGV